MPTGRGKSLCYSMTAAIETDLTTLVVSPLVSQIKDQIINLKAIKTLKVFCLVANSKEFEANNILKRLVSSNLD